MMWTFRREAAAKPPLARTKKREEEAFFLKSDRASALEHKRANKREREKVTHIERAIFQPNWKKMDRNFVSSRRENIANIAYRITHVRDDENDATKRGFQRGAEKEKEEESVAHRRLFSENSVVVGVRRRRRTTTQTRRL